MKGKIIILLVLTALLTMSCGAGDNPTGKWKMTITHSFFEGNSYFPNGNWGKVLQLTSDGKIEDGGKIVGNWSTSKESGKDHTVIDIHIDWKFGGIRGFQLNGSIVEANKMKGTGKILQSPDVLQFRYGCYWETERFE